MSLSYKPATRYACYLNGRIAALYSLEDRQDYPLASNVIQYVVSEATSRYPFRTPQTTDKGKVQSATSTSTYSFGNDTVESVRRMWPRLRNAFYTIYPMNCPRIFHAGLPFTTAPCPIPHRHALSIYNGALYRSDYLLTTMDRMTATLYRLNAT